MLIQVYTFKDSATFKTFAVYFAMESYLYINRAAELLITAQSRETL